MDWFTGEKQAEAKRLIVQLVNPTKRDRAVQGLIRLGSDAIPIYRFIKPPIFPD